MRPLDPPPPTYAFGYRAPPRSGNEINGLGVRERVRARQVFHDSGRVRLDWRALDRFFSLINPWGALWHIVRNRWQLRRAEGPVANAHRPVDDPAAMAAEIKAVAQRLGAGIVGITRVDETALYEGESAAFPTAICLGLPMDRAEMAHVPQPRAAVEVLRVYREVSRVAIELSEHIRALGWGAKAYGNPNSTEILHIPLAIKAGLGELGKHGSIISREYGSNFRLAAVLTELPLAVDGSIDIGVEDLCLSCVRCVLDCSPLAIVNDKQTVRGVDKWYVDFDKCIPYFTKTFGCAICIEVCPWSEPGRGPRLSETLLAKRTARTGAGEGTAEDAKHPG